MDVCGRWLLAAVLPWFVLPAFAGAPSLDENCHDKSNRRVPTRYDVAATNYFAEARVDGQSAAIYINPDRYFLGQRTQQWLYQRQCVHIQKDHAIAKPDDRGQKPGERAPKPEDEEEADCLAMREMANSPAQGSSVRTLRAAVESDMERVLKEDRWRQVMPGPQRRISFDKCPG
jgi:hypothetical protein